MIIWEKEVILLLYVNFPYWLVDNQPYNSKLPNRREFVIGQLLQIRAFTFLSKPWDVMSAIPLKAIECQSCKIQNHIVIVVKFRSFKSWKNKIAKYLRTYMVV